jgi:hypothetical protein
MTTHSLKSNILVDKAPHRMPTGVLVVRLAVLFTIICTVATAVMLLG